MAIDPHDEATVDLFEDDGATVIADVLQVMGVHGIDRVVASALAIHRIVQDESAGSDDGFMPSVAPGIRRPN